MRGARTFAPVFLLALLCRAAWADGPHIAFHAVQGSYAVTLFSAPDPLVAGPAELNLLVQNAADGSLVSPAEASGELELPGHAPVHFAFQPGGAANGQLPGATIPLPDAGSYELLIALHVAGSDPLRFAGILPVAANHGRRNTVVLAVVLPGAFILLFLINQYAKGEMHRRRRKLSDG